MMTASMLDHTTSMLLASVVALGLAPVLAFAVSARPEGRAALDGFVVVALVGLVAVEILPLTWASAGPWVLPALLAGYVLPRYALDHSHVLARGPADLGHAVVIAAAVLGVALHSASDGLAIAGAHHHGGGGHAIEAAVVIHRVPGGLATWSLLRERLGRGAAAAGLAFVAISTVLGFAAGEELWAALDGPALAIVQAVTAGLLLHVVTELPRPEPVPGTAGSGRLAAASYAGLGGLLALALVLSAFGDVGHGHGAPGEHGTTNDVLVSALSLLQEAAPALLVAYALSGVVATAMGAASAAFMARGGTGTRALKGVLVGLPLPLCSCGVIAVYRTLVTRGAPAAASFAFLVATPELGLEALLMTIPLLGPSFAIVRLVAAFVIALIVGVWIGGWVDRIAPKVAPTVETTAPRQPLATRIRSALRIGFVETVDDTIAWIVVGILLAATLEGMVAPEAFAAVPSWAQVPLLALVGVPLYVCATGATPLAAVLVARGVSPGAALAFLLTGPATNATTWGTVASLHGRRVATAFIAAMAALTIVMGWLVDLFFTATALSVLAIPDLHHTHGLDALWDPWVLAVLVLLVASFVRQGPWRFVASLWPSPASAEPCADACGHDHGHPHDHDHDHHHGHDHGHPHDHGHDHDHGHHHDHEHAHAHAHAHTHAHEHGHAHTKPGDHEAVARAPDSGHAH